MRVQAVRQRLPQHSEHPFDPPFVRTLDLAIRTPVTFFVGENGTGKSTLLEALASLCGLPISGGSRNDLVDRPETDQVSVLSPVLRP